MVRDEWDESALRVWAETVDRADEGVGLGDSGLANQS
jgi:hypothetical protein